MTWKVDDNSYLHEGGGLCSEEQLEKLAPEGDYQSVWKFLLENERGLIDQPECFRLLLQAVEVAARKEPRKFSADIFAKVIGFSSYLLLRSHFQISTLFDRHDAALCSLGNLHVPREIAEIIPSLIQLQEHVAAMLEAQARAARMWGLAGKEPRNHPDGKTAVKDGPTAKPDALPFRVASPPMNHVAEQA